jgi:CBS domain-containing protein
LDNLAKKIHQQNTDATITAATILKNKDPAILTITPDTLISEASKILTDKRIGCVIALNSEGKIAGILSERDIVNGIANAGQPILNLPATQLMTHNVTVSHPEDSMATLMSVMSSKRIRHLPVVDSNDHLVGVISIGDIINTRMIELEQESDAMHQYIEGRKWREVAMQIGRSAAAEEFS